MVKGRVWLTGGGSIRIQAADMLSALKMVTAAYDGKIKRMTLEAKEGETDGKRREVDQDNNGYFR